MARVRAGWTQTDPGVHGKGGRWEHGSGWEVRHCGHPTAHWPYYAIDPNTGGWLLSGGMGLGYAFPRLDECQEAVEQVVAGKCEINPMGDD